MTLTEQRIGELWDEAVGGGWTLDHKMIVDFVRRVEATICAHSPATHAHNGARAGPGRTSGEHITDCPRCNHFHRRAQLAEAALAATDPERLERAGQSGGSLARSLLRWYAQHSIDQRDEASQVAHDLAEALFAEITGSAEPGEAERALRRYEELRRGADR